MVQYGLGSMAKGGTRDKAVAYLMLFFRCGVLGAFGVGVIPLAATFHVFLRH